MEVNLNPSMTRKPQPITATKPHQYLLPVEGGKYPTFNEIYRAQILTEMNRAKFLGQITPKQLQSTEDIKGNFHELLVRTNEGVSLQNVTKISELKIKENAALNFQRDSYLLARLLKP
jgi:hypothetical protein